MDVAYLLTGLFYFALVIVVVERVFARVKT